jgi:hypothetical protein
MWLQTGGCAGREPSRNADNNYTIVFLRTQVAVRDRQKFLVPVWAAAALCRGFSPQRETTRVVERVVEYGIDHRPEQGISHVNLCNYCQLGRLGRSFTMIAAMIAYALFYIPCSSLTKNYVLLATGTGPRGQPSRWAGRTILPIQTPQLEVPPLQQWASPSRRYLFLWSVSAYTCEDG